MIGTRHIVVLALVAALAVPAVEQPASALPDSTTDPAPSAKKKKKKKKKRKRCRKSQVRVKSGKKRTCVAARKVLPKPKAGDPRLLIAKSAYRDWSKLRNRRGKRAKSLPKLVRKLGPRAKGLLNTATVQGVDRIDQMIASASASRRGPPARRSPLALAAAGGCTEVPRGARDQSTYTSSEGGTTASATSTLGPEGAAMALEMSGNGFTIKADLDFGACEPNEVEAPQCPTAAGRLQGELRYKMKVSIQVSKGGEDVWSQSMNVTRKTKLDGFTDVDAKLDDLDISDEEISNVNLGGAVRAYPPIGIRTRLIRNTRVNMRTGNYEPGISDITVTVNVDGLYGADRSEIQDDLERRGRADADQQFRTIVAKAIDGYRTREEAWQQPDKCAKLEFNPVNNALRLRRGGVGSFTTIAKAVQDGGASELDARLSNPVNATFSPTRAGGQSARFEYNVFGSSGKVTAYVKATSKAGVADDTWEQPITQPFQVNVISGTFSGSQRQWNTQSGFDSTVTWQGNITLVKQFAAIPGATGNYIPVDGIVTYSHSGWWWTASANCQQSGTDSFDIPSDSGSMGVFPEGNDPYVKGPHNYGANIAINEEMTVTLHSCVPGADEYEGTQQPAYVGQVILTDDNEVSPDGLAYNGNYVKTDSAGSGHVEITANWTLTGEEE